MEENMLLSTLLLSTLRFSEKEREIYKKTDRLIHFMKVMHTIPVANIATFITGVIEIYIIKMDNMSFMIITLIFQLNFPIF